MRNSRKTDKASEQAIETVYGVCVTGPNKGKRYRAYECGGVAYWTIEDIGNGIPAAVRSGMEGFDLENYLVQ